MKANLKGLGGIKGFFLLHGEKLAIAAVALCTLLLIYYSTRLERLPNQYQAAELESQITRTKSSIDNAEWNAAVTDHPDDVRTFEPLAKKANLDVEPEHYPISGLDPPVIKAVVPRSDPTFMAAVDVRATGGSGLLPFLDEKVMKERQLKRQAAAEKKAKEQAKQTEQEQQEQAEGGRGGRGRNRGEGREMDYEYDPEHPKRRPVEGSYGRAPGAMVQGDERIERAVWAIVVAKVPIKEQLKLYRTSFENTRGGFDPQADFPSYAGYRVERAEVQPGQPLQWQPVDVYDGQGKKMGAVFGGPTLTKLDEVIASEWALQMPEIVDERYLDFERVLTYPLPPLLGRDWGAEVTHPDIPLAINAPPPEEEVEPTPQQTGTPDAANDGDEFGTRDPNSAGGARMGGPMMQGRGFGGRGGMLGGEEGFRGRSMGGRGFGGGRGMMMERGEGGMGRGWSGGGGRGTTGVLPRNVTHWLLRFFDFSVQPGKKYKYRVKLALYDPNQGTHIDSNTLDSKVVNRLRASLKASRANPKRPSPFVETAWSEPSPSVGIPLSGSVRLAEAKAPTGKQFNEEPAATLLVEAFDLDAEGNAIHGAKEKEFRRGFVANMVEETEYLTPDGRSIDTQESFKFLTGVTVVDVAGGERLVGEMQAPARVLLLDPAGELFIRTELDDSEAVKLHKALFAKPDKRRGRDQESEMRGGRGRGFSPFGEG